MLPNKAHPTTNVPSWLVLLCVALLAMQAAIALVEIPGWAGRVSGIDWIAPENLAKRKNDSKLLLYYFCADWCEGCHKLEATAFKNKPFVDLVNREFVPIKVVDRHKETGKNSFTVAELEGKYNVMVFPSMVVALPSGERAYAFVGAHSSWQAMKELKQALSRADYARGKADLQAGNDREAVNAFRNYLSAEGWRESQSRYAAIFCCIAYAEEQKFEEMQKFAEAATRLADKHDWPYPALRFFAGQITADELKEMTEQEKGKLTEAKYYLGAYLCAKGNMKEGKEPLEWVAKEGKRDYEEYEFTLSRLRRLKSSP